jgi:hypothetical protein
MNPFTAVMGCGGIPASCPFPIGLTRNGSRPYPAIHMLTPGQRILDARLHVTVDIHAQSFQVCCASLYVDFIIKTPIARSVR